MLGGGPEVVRVVLNSSSSSSYVFSAGTCRDLGIQTLHWDYATCTCTNVENRPLVGIPAVAPKVMPYKPQL